ncbi:nitronate monooxygenase [Gorillibacterium sp. CAU 1737]|uniref:NAD(P)H-dependent flavin oxidoreductase n=1 Tax=Gorillibacterium sp. CAU 1737 TaxID=3140362 RepID=UPI0032616BDC
MGHIAGPELAAEVSRAGGLGTLGAEGLPSEELRERIRTLRRRTESPFAVNVHVPTPESGSPPDEEALRRTMMGLAEARQELGLPDSREEPVELAQERQRRNRLHEEQLAVLLQERVPVVSFTGGILDNEWIDQLKRAGILLIGTATTVSEGAHLEHQGVDLVVAQGSEAGGERGTFLGAAEQAAVGTMALVPMLADILHVPVIAAGGIMDGRGIAAALVLGAQGVQLGTAFLACRESEASRRTKELVLSSMEESTVLTRAYTGRLTRALRNHFVAHGSGGEDRIASWPYQEALTRTIREAAEEQERPDYMAVYAGQASRLGTDELPAADRLAQLVSETDAAFTRLRELAGPANTGEGPGEA